MSTVERARVHSNSARWFVVSWYGYLICFDVQKCIQLFDGDDTCSGWGYFAYSILCQFLHFVADVKKAAAKASGSKRVTGSKTATSSKLVEKKGLFAPASPAMSKKIATSTAARKYSLRATEAGKDLLTFINLNIKLTFLSANLWWEEAPAQSSWWSP